MNKIETGKESANIFNYYQNKLRHAFSGIDESIEFNGYLLMGDLNGIQEFNHTLSNIDF